MAVIARNNDTGKSREYDHKLDSFKIKNSVGQMRSLLRHEHLNSEKKENVDESFSSDCFHLPGERLGSTKRIAHRIITTDVIPIYTKQYRFPPIHKEKINKQTSLQWQMKSSDL